MGRDHGQEVKDARYKPGHHSFKDLVIPWLGLVGLIWLMAFMTKPQLPWRSVPDTRGIDTVTVVDDVLPGIVSMYVGSVEQAGCLYGRVNSPVLVIDSFAPAKIHHADSVSVNYICEHNKSFVGIVHTHLNKGMPWCVHSDLDSKVLLDDDRILISYILCYGGVGTMRLKDGRYYQFRWGNVN